MFLVAVMAWAGVHWSAQPRKLAVALGVIGAALALTKINVGVFLFVGAGAWGLLHLDEQKAGLRARGWLVGGAMAVLPFALMRTQLGQTWVAVFASVASAAGAAVVRRERWVPSTPVKLG